MTGGNNDAQLMTRYAGGDVAAFEALYARHKGPLYRYLFRQCANPDNADQLFQDVWVRIIKARERYEPQALFTTYLYQIAHQCLQDHFRKAGRSLTDETGEPAAEAKPGPIAEDLDPAFASARWSLVDWEQGQADASPGAPVASSGEQRGARLRSALEGLPLAQREAFLLHEEADMGLADIAAVTGVNAAAVKTRLGQALKKLRSSLGEPAPSPVRRAGA